MSLLLAGGAVPETITIDKWYKQHDNPVRKGLQVAAIVSSFFFVPDAVAESGAWGQPQSQRQKKVEIRQTAGETRTEVVVSGGETITLDKWYRPASEPYFTKRREANTGQTFLDVPRTVLLTDWFQPASEPVRRKPTQLLGGEYRFEVPRTILLNDWFAEIRQPYFSKLRLLPYGEYRFEVPRTILVTDWFQPISQPSRVLKITVVGETRVDVEETQDAGIMDWFREVSQPYFSKKRNYFTGEFRFEVPREVLITDWFQPISVPYLKQPRQNLGGETRTELEIVTLDDWFEAIAQPYLNRVAVNNGGEFVFDVPFIPPIPDDGGGGGIIEKKKQYEYEQTNTLEEIIKQDNELIELIKIFLQCRRKV